MASFTIPSVFKAVDKLSGPVKTMQKTTTRFASSAEQKFARAERKVRSLNNSVSNLSGGMSGMQQAFGAAMAVFAGGQFVSSISNMQKLQSQVKTLFDVTEKEAQKATDQVQVLSTKFDVQENEILQATNAVQKQMGTGYKETFKIIEEGFNKGGNIQGEFLDQLKEFPAQFKELGLNASEAVSVITQSQKQGVFSDKGVDSIKEAGIQLREMPKATKETVNELFNSGEAASNLSKRLETGETTMFQEIQRISEKMSEADKQMQGKVLADIFKGPGEDAVGFVKALQNVNTNLDKQEKEITPFRKNWQKLQEVYVKLKNTLTRVLVPAFVSVFRSMKPVGEWLVSNKSTVRTVAKAVLFGALAFGAFKATLFAVQGALKVVRGAMIAYNVVTGIMTAFTNGSAIALRSSKAALIGYKIATSAATAVQYAFNAALSANPIGLVIAGVAALIGLIVAVTKKWDSWGSTVAFFLGPIGLVISMFKSFKRNWEAIKEAFETKGIIGGLKAIGLTILDSMLAPLQSVLETVGMLPDWLGGGVASNAASSIKDLRDNITKLGDSVENANSKAQGENGDAQRAEPNEKQAERTEKKIEQNFEKVQLDINDNTGAAKLNRQNSGKRKPKVKMSKSVSSFVLNNSFE